MSSSTSSKLSRYVWGGSTARSSTHLHWWERRTLPKDNSDTFYVIEQIYERTNYWKLAFALYGIPELGMFILQYNSIMDPMKEFTEGRVIRVPTQARVMAFINSSKTGGVTKEKSYTRNNT